MVQKEAEEPEKLTVDELMAQADALSEAGHYRSAVMEAFTALEERVNIVVFGELERNKGLSKPLVDWIRQSTRMKFDDRLHPIGEFALGKSISKGDVLWAGYTKAKAVRNRVSHTAARVSRAEAKLVITTVRGWLHFLGDVEESPQAFHSGELFQDFFKWHALYASHFRMVTERERPLHLHQVAKLLSAASEITSTQASEMIAVQAIRNKLAHGTTVKDQELRSGTETIKKLLVDFKGREFGPF